MTHFSLIVGIDGIDLCEVGIKVHSIHPEVHPIYLVYPYLVFHLSQGHSNAPKSVFYLEKLAVGQLIIPNRNVIT